MENVVKGRFFPVKVGNRTLGKVLITKSHGSRVMVILRAPPDEDPRGELDEHVFMMMRPPAHIKFDVLFARMVQMFRLRNQSTDLLKAMILYQIADGLVSVDDAFNSKGFLRNDFLWADEMVNPSLKRSTTPVIRRIEGERAAEMGVWYE